LQFRVGRPAALYRSADVGVEGGSMADEAKRAPGDEAETKRSPCSSDSSSSSSSSEEEEDDDDDFGVGGALATSFAAMDVGVRTGRRGSVMAAPLEVAPSWSPPEFRKTAEERAAIEAALRLNILFERLGDEEMAVMVGAMQAQSFEPATSIIRQGEDGDLFYILEEGVCDIFVEGVGRVMQVVGGDARNFFGELALLYNVPRAATVTTVTDVRCWALDRTTFKTIGMQATTAQRKLHGEFVAQVPLLATLSPIERLTLADALMPLTLSAAEEIVTEGEPGKCFYIIEAGELMVTKRG